LVWVRSQVYPGRTVVEVQPRYGDRKADESRVVDLRCDAHRGQNSDDDEVGPTEVDLSGRGECPDAEVLGSAVTQDDLWISLRNRIEEMSAQHRCGQRFEERRLGR